MRARWFLAIVVLVLRGCEAGEDPGVAVPEQTTTAEPVWAGCDDYVDSACVLVVREGRTQPLRMWLDVPPSVALAVAFDGRPVEVAGDVADGGTRLRLDVPPGAQAVTVRGQGVDARLDIVWHRHDPVFAAARAAFDAGRPQEGCSLLAKMPADALALDRVRATALDASQCGDPDDQRRTAEMFGKAAEIASAASLSRSFVQAASAALYTCLERLDDRNCAVSWSERLGEAWSTEALVTARYSRGLLAVERGELVAALDHFAESERWADRLGMRPEHDAALEQRANVLAELGRVEASRSASASLYATVHEREDACERARIINNAAWPQQVLAEAGLQQDPPLDWMIEEALIYEHGECTDERGRLMARINLASAFLAEGEVDDAHKWLAQILNEDLPGSAGDLVPEIEYLTMAVALQSNRWELAPVPLLGLAERSGDARLRWRSRVQDAQMLERFGLTDPALDAWRRAEEILDAEVSSLGVAQGRETFISARWTSALGLVEGLLRAEHTSEAMCRIRLARGRALRAADRRVSTGARPELAQFDAFARIHNALDVEAAEDWSYSGDELVRRHARRDQRRREALALVEAPWEATSAESLGCAMLPAAADDELLVAIYPTSGDTIAIAEGPRGTDAFRLPRIPEDEAAKLAWADGLLAELGKRLEGIAVLRVLPVSTAWTIPVHAARVGGAPVIDRAAVTYGLDLPRRITPARTATRAIVVADPSEDLPHAREEQDFVRTTLAAAGWQVDVLGGRAADRATVMHELGGADLFHYAGHGVHRGEDGWDAALLLDRAMTIEPADVLAASDVPRVVVLAGCETGAVRSALVDGGMSLGRAFLLAGSDVVLVGDRKIRDEDSVAFVRALYRESDAPLGFDPVASVRRAYRERADSGAPVEAWSGFRVLVR